MRSQSVSWTARDASCVLRGDVATAMKLQFQLMPVHKNLFVEANPIPVKWAMARMGLCGHALRLPLTQLSAPQQPVVEAALKASGERFVANDCRLSESDRLWLVGGPNMGGKSTYLRQTALLPLLAQIGSFVPARDAKVPIVDRIFARVGASDNIARGQSTFMVEMNETSAILNNLSSRCLVLLDEIGRGTSTYDGISIAWSIAEFLHQSVHKPKTLFATHYHELNEMTQLFPRIKNFNVSVKESGNKIIFLRKLKEGGSEHSFGIHVARMAGSLLRSAGLNELITYERADYEKKAIYYANHRAELQKLRDRLRDEKDSGRLFDTERFASEFETALLALYSA